MAEGGAAVNFVKVAGSEQATCLVASDSPYIERLLREKHPKARIIKIPG